MSGVNNIDYSAVDTIEATVVNLASGVSPTMPAGAKGATVTVEKKALRYRSDGEDPTAAIATGDLLNVGDILTFDSWTVPKNNWRQVMLRTNFIQAVANTTGAISVHWYD